MSDIMDRLKTLGLSLPQVIPPLAAYVPATRSGHFLYTAGQIPLHEAAAVAQRQRGERGVGVSGAAITRPRRAGADRSGSIPPQTNCRQLGAGPSSAPPDWAAPVCLSPWRD